ncbi:MAG TPA: hypothetical protein VF589_05965 [Allosphingosinicella sp.]|jgi:uncharacterized membrane protein YkoI
MGFGYATANTKEIGVLVMRILFLLVAALGITAIAPDADARPRRDRDREQDAAYRARQEGRIMPLPRIERSVRPRMNGADYLGPELDSRSGTYRLKFMRRGRVIWVDVDARTGQVRGQSGE